MGSLDLRFGVGGDVVRVHFDVRDVLFGDVFSVPDFVVVADLAFGREEETRPDGAPGQGSLRRDSCLSPEAHLLLVVGDGVVGVVMSCCIGEWAEDFLAAAENIYVSMCSDKFVAHVRVQLNLIFRSVGGTHKT